MPVDTPHPTYVQTLETWKFIRDALSGEGAVKTATTAYLPQLSEQSGPAYDAYRARAQFIEITKRTHETLAGFVFRKDPQYIFDDALVPFMDDATLSGLSFYDWLKDTARAALGVGRRGTLIDWDDIAKRPFLVPYEAEDVKNWKMSSIGGRMALTLLVLREDSNEHYEETGEQAPDQFEHKSYEQYRVYEVLTDGEGGLPYVQCQLWRRKQSSAPTHSGTASITIPGTGPSGMVGQGSGWIAVETKIPARGGFILARIPFVFHGPNNFLPAIDAAPMESIARVNFSHYRTTADLENGLHFSGLPQVWTKGFGEDASKLPIGINQAWVSDKEWAETGYLQVSSGFEGLEKAAERKMTQMAALGARMFDATQSKQSGAEAYDTVRIRQTGETVTLTNVAIALTQSASKVIQWAGWWLNRSAKNPEDLAERFNVEINTDFIEVGIPSDKLTALQSLWQAMGISHRTLYFNLNKGEIYPPDTDYETELKEINEGGPTIPGATDTEGEGFGGGSGGLTKSAG